MAISCWLNGHWEIQLSAKGQDNKRILPIFIDSMYGLGTPEDLEKFLTQAANNVS